MDDNNIYLTNSSQESLPLSQETFNSLWIKTEEDCNMLMTNDGILETNSQPCLSQEAFEDMWNVMTSSSILPSVSDGSIDHSYFNTVLVAEDTNCRVDTDASPQIDSPSVQNLVSSSSTGCVPSSLPASQNWPGDYGFTVSFSTQAKNTKGVAWTYSKTKDKLYVAKDAPCPINFSANQALPSGVSIRAMALYNSPDHASEVVHRCVNHSIAEVNRGVFEANHLMRCESSMAFYEVDQITQHHSVIVPFENPAAGQQYATYIYKFACFGSCTGGPNRRPIMIIFSLEENGQVVGRRRLDVKICACPGRDSKTEEQQLGPLRNVNVPGKKKKIMSLSDTLDFTRSIPMQKTKKHKASSNEGSLVIKADDVEQYEFLEQMKKFHRMCKAMNSLPPSLKKSLVHHTKKYKSRHQEPENPNY